MTNARRKLRRIRHSVLMLETCEDRILMAIAPSLGVAASFVVLGGSTVTNTGLTTLVGDLGVSPGTAITGFPPGVISGGTIHAGDAIATQAGADLATAYNILAGEAVDTPLSGDLGGMTLTPGVYNFSSSAQLTGTLTLDAQGDSHAVFVIQVGSTLTTATSSSVNLINGARARNIYWQVGSSATLGAGTAFAGNILALTSVTLTTGASISAGRALAINGAVTMDTNSLSNVFTTPLTITADNQAKLYGAALPPLTASYSGFIDGDTPASLTTQPTITTTATAGSPVGAYAITASGAVDPDYVITYVAGSLAVTPASLTITADNQAKPYGAALPPLTASYSGFVNGDAPASLTTQPALATTATAASRVGAYAVTASGAVDPDYVITYVAGSLAVTPASLTITADNQSKPYGAALPPLTARFNGFVNGDTPTSLTTLPTLATTATAASRVGAYAVTASGAVDPNYVITYLAGTLAVTPASLTITADNQSKLYGAALPPLTASYSGFVNGDTPASLTTQPTLATTATAASRVGAYAVTASGAVDPDYVITYVAGILAVTPAPLTITADNQSKLYGAALPPLTASYSGFVNGDAPASLTTLPTLATTATAASRVGAYAVTASGAVDPDYAISYVPGTLDVAPGVLSVIGVQRYGFHMQATYLVLSFSGPLDPARAQNPENYSIVQGNPRGGLTHNRITVGEAIYDPVTATVTLVPTARLNLHWRYFLTVNGATASGLRSLSGVPLQATGVGQLGSDYRASINFKNLAGRADQLPTAGLLGLSVRKAVPRGVLSHIGYKHRIK